MKTIIWDTNFNGKLACNRFLHIDLAPAKLPTLKELDENTFLIKVADASAPPVEVKVEAIIPFKITELSNIHTWPSHGMYSAEYIEMQHLKKPINKETEFAVYYYKKANIN